MFTSYQVIILADMCDKTHHETIGPNNQRLAITARSGKGIYNVQHD
jgi:hypothetical protein